MNHATGRLWKCWHCGTVAAQEVVITDGQKTNIFWLDGLGNEVVRPAECNTCHSLLLLKDQS